jgi:hypothetical protein
VRLAALCAVLVGVGSRVEAQGIAKSFDELRLLVRAGDTVTVVDTGGLQTVVKITQLSSSSMSVLVTTAPGMRRDFREEQVARIFQRRSDPLGNGALWGLAIGAGFGIVTEALYYDSSEGGAGWIAVGAALYGGLGAGIGVGVDAMITKPTIIFERPATRSSRIAIAPTFNGGRRGVMVAFRF